jgi:hypothetical protein
MDLANLSTLKQKLVDETNFHSIWDHFMTNFGERREFAGVGQRTSSPLLEAAIGQAAKEVFGTKVPLRNLLLIRLPEQHFIHRPLSLSGRIAKIIYFEDIGVGLLSIGFTPPAENRFVRFTSAELPGGKMARH